MKKSMFDNPGNCFAPEPVANHQPTVPCALPSMGVFGRVLIAVVGVCSAIIGISLLNVIYETVARIPPHKIDDTNCEIVMWAILIGVPIWALIYFRAFCYMAIDMANR